MRLLQRIGSAIKWPGRKISDEIAEELADKATVALRASLVELDRLAPVLTDLIAGRKIVVHTKIDLWIEENPGDTK